ncbi:TPA: antirestriction protein [Raoultella ornithinolytica]|nr:antirestriction protein [Raoultella ornithinolytica]
MDNVAMINMQPVCYAAIYLEFFHNRAHVDECFRYWADELSGDYGGGSRHNPMTCNPKWEGRRLSNGGFYLTPMSRLTYLVSVAGNGYEGTMTAEAFGITLSLFALGQIANTTEDDGDILLYHALRDYALDHSESVEIMAAID